MLANIIWTLNYNCNEWVVFNAFGYLNLALSLAIRKMLSLWLQYRSIKLDNFDSFFNLKKEWKLVNFNNKDPSSRFYQDHNNSFLKSFQKWINIHDMFNMMEAKCRIGGLIVIFQFLQLYFVLDLIFYFLFF